MSKIKYLYKYIIIHYKFFYQLISIYLILFSHNRKINNNNNYYYIINNNNNNNDNNNLSRPDPTENKKE